MRYSTWRAFFAERNLWDLVSHVFNVIEMALCEIVLEVRWLFGKNRFQNSDSSTADLVILSLTSYRPRFRYLLKTLKSLILQDYPNFRIVVNLAEIDFDLMPRNLRRMCKFKVEFNRIEQDLKVFLKLLPTLENNPNSIIVTADDDIYYGKRWLSTLVEFSSEYPSCITGYRAIHVPNNLSNSSYVDWPSPKTIIESNDSLLLTGVAGILYPIGTFAGQNELILKLRTLSPRNDDLAYFVASNILGLSRVYFPCKFSHPRYWNGSQQLALWRTNVTGNHNDSQYQALMEFKEKLNSSLEN
jgi:hypothetical protein